MQSTDASSSPRFYFALPRLIGSWFGGDARRSEKNGVESNAVGSLLHLVVYAFAFELCLTSRSVWHQILFALPVAIIVWLFWLNLLYANSWVITGLRACGLIRDLPQIRAQGVLIGTVTTLFAVRLLEARGWTHLVGAIWIATVILNLAAAVILAATNADRAPTKP